MVEETTKEDKVKGLNKYSVKCSVCGEIKAARKEIYDKRVAKFGSVEEMNKSYVCRKCKKK